MATLDIDANDRGTRARAFDFYEPHPGGKITALIRQGAQRFLTS